MKSYCQIATKRRNWVIGLLVVSLGLSLSAGERWSGKDYRQWSNEEVNRLLTDSPWAKQVSAIFITARLEEERPVDPPPGASTANMGGTRGATDGRWDGGIGRNVDDSAPKLPVTVRWDSALPVREALMRSRVAAGSGGLEGAKENLNEPENSYILTVTGLLASDQSRDRERLRKELIGTTKLVRPGKPVIRPEDVKVDASMGAIEVLFPKTERISQNDKEVTFELQFGSIVVQAKFRLKAMTYQGRLEL